MARKKRERTEGILRKEGRKGMKEGYKGRILRKEGNEGVREGRKEGRKEGR